MEILCHSGIYTVSGYYLLITICITYFTITKLVQGANNKLINQIAVWPAQYSLGIGLGTAQNGVNTRGSEFPGKSTK